MVGNNIIEKAKDMIVPDTKVLKRGTYVRIAKNTESNYRKDMEFTKKYMKNWSDEVYRIISVSNSKVHQYRLRDSNDEKLDKVYYIDQLLEVDVDKLILPKVQSIPNTRQLSSRSNEVEATTTEPRRTSRIRKVPDRFKA